jgi:hypothetical protein
MNPAAIDQGLDKCPGPQGPGAPAVCNNDFYNRILNIAGIGAGDTVACLDGERAFVEKALSARGASIRAVSADFDAGREPKLRRKNDACIDAILWALDGFPRDNPVRTLANLRHSLQPGGRLVLWITSDNFHNRQVDPKRIDSLLVSAGFVSVIVGRLPLNGQDAVVATGVLGKKANA